MKSQNKKSGVSRRGRRGFTIIELLVSIAVFGILVSIGVGGFTRALRTQRQVAALISASSNVSLALEQMAREMRTGSSFCAGPNAGLCPTNGEIVFTNAQGAVVDYRLGASGEIERGVRGVFQSFTGSNVNVNYLNFRLFGENAGDGYAPRITISLGISAKDSSLTGNIVRLQTTVSSRLPDS